MRRRRRFGPNASRDTYPTLARTRPQPSSSPGGSFVGAARAQCCQLRHSITFFAALTYRAAGPLPSTVTTASEGCFENHTAARDRPFRLLQLADVDCAHAEAPRLQSASRARETCRIHQRVADPNSICRIGLDGVDFEPVVRVERTCWKPPRIEEKGFAGNCRHRRFEMQTAAHLDAVDRVSVRGDSIAQLR